MECQCAKIIEEQRKRIEELEEVLDEIECYQCHSCQEYRFNDFLMKCDLCECKNCEQCCKPCEVCRSKYCLFCQDIQHSDQNKGHLKVCDCCQQIKCIQEVCILCQKKSCPDCLRKCVVCHYSFCSLCFRENICPPNEGRCRECHFIRCIKCYHLDDFKCVAEIRQREILTFLLALNRLTHLVKPPKYIKCLIFSYVVQGYSFNVVIYQFDLTKYWCVKYGYIVSKSRNTAFVHGIDINHDGNIRQLVEAEERQAKRFGFVISK